MGFRATEDAATEMEGERGGGKEATAVDVPNLSEFISRDGSGGGCYFS